MIPPLHHNDNNGPASPSDNGGKKYTLDDIKRILDRCSPNERQEIALLLNGNVKLDLIELLPMYIVREIFNYLTPNQLCICRSVSKRWYSRATDSMLWKQHCTKYGILPENHILRDGTSISGEEGSRIYYDLFRRAMTVAKNWNRPKPMRQKLYYHKGPVLALTIIDSNYVISGDIDGTIYNYSIREKKVVHCLTPHRSDVACLTHDPYYLASGSSDCTICIITLPEFRIREKLLGHQAPVVALAFGDYDRPYAHILFSGSVDGTIRIWDTISGQCVRVLRGQQEAITSLLYVPPIPISDILSPLEYQIVSKNLSGWLLSGSTDKSVYLWDLRTDISDVPCVTGAIMEVNGPVTALAFYAELQESVADQLTTGNPYLKARRELSIPPFLLVAGRSDPTFTLWSLPIMDPTWVKPPIDHKNSIWDIACAPIHAKIITASADMTAKIWDLRLPNTVHIVDGFDSAVVSCRISQQEDLIVFGTENGTINILYMYDFE
ncbi:WD40-repeat-containing domain protein [Dichotomocladium elegans]|nr:WD40-repeat-containing domain protein [Dichotomocladium elegans]